MSLITEYPFWLVIFCFAAGIAYSGVLYFRNKKLTEFTVWKLRLLSIFRFLVITIISFFLLSPLLKINNSIVEKPVIIIAQDNSESLIVGKNADFYKREYKQNLQKLIDKLNDKYEVKSYSFGDKINELKFVDSLNFNEKQTDLSSLFDEIDTRYSNRNVGAIVLASDGIYNKGSNPVFTSSKIKTPVYTIALGDTAIKKDVVIAKVEHNRLAYLGNKFPVQVIVNAKQYKGKSATLTINKGETILFTQVVNFNSDNFLVTIPFLLDATQVGMQHYKAQLTSLPEEISVSNNVSDFFIDVLDARQKVLILSDIPHPDIAALKQTIEFNKNYEVERLTITDFNKSVKKYNLVILYQLPNTSNPITKIIADLKALSTPVLLFTGANTLVKNNLSIAGSTQKTNESEAVLNQHFPLFTITDDLRNALKNFPAVVSPYTNNLIDNSSNVLLYQKIGVVETKNPLMVFNTEGDYKSGIFFGEGIWRWRFQDFAEHGNHNMFDELISKTVQYLSVKVDKSFFKITGKTVFLENQPIELNAEVYNESYELINEPEVTISITNYENKKFPFSFNKSTNAYILNAGIMPVGEYTYEAKTKVGDKLYLQRGEFSVNALQVELVNTIADHQMLYSLAKKHDGEMVYPTELEQLAENLNNRDDIKSVSYFQKKLNDLINVKALFFLLLFLLSAEWFIRKRNGNY